MTQEFDTFRMKIASQYVELTRKTLASLENDLLEITKVIGHISDTFDNVNWTIVNQAEDILFKGKVVVEDF